MCGHTIGEYIMVVAGAVVAKDVESYALIAGALATVSGKVDCFKNVQGD